jgi:magnesium transporter
MVMTKSKAIASLVVEDVPFARVDETAGAVRAALRVTRFACIDLVLVSTHEGLYHGAADLRDVLVADPDVPIGKLVLRDIPFVNPLVHQEPAAELAGEAGVAALPVVGVDGRVLGVLPPGVLLTVRAHEHHEDLHRLVGILHERQSAKAALEDPPIRRAGRRLPWLLVGAAASAAMTALMMSFEADLQRNVTIAFFIPALVYLADAIGTQTETIAVRGLSTQTRPLARILLLEVAAGGLIGATLGILAFGGIWLAFADLPLAAGAAISLFAAGTVASAIGLLLPWGLSRLGLDPAFGSGPVATVLQDGVTILVYFQVMSVALPA